jgi:hypothetical protein
MQALSSRRIGIRAKLVGSAAILLAFMTIVGVVGISTLGSVKTEADAMYANAAKPLADLGVARAKLNENRALTLSHLLESNRSEAAELVRTMEANNKLVDSSLATVKETLETEEGKAAFAKLEADLKDYRAERSRVMELSTAGRDTEAFAAYKSEVVPTAAKLVDDFTALFDSKVELARTKSEDVDAAAASGKTRAIVLILLALAAGLGISLLIARGIQRGVEAVLNRLTLLKEHCTTDLAAALQGVARGDLTIVVTPVTPELERTSTRSATWPRPSALSATTRWQPSRPTTRRASRSRA